jgi:uncharacterized protein involved in exopolysaccharide biosynthesis
MAAGNQMDGDLDIDVASLFVALWRDKFKLLFGALVLSALVGVALFFVSPRYESEASVLIKESESVFSRPQGTPSEDKSTIFDEQGIISQVRILTSTEFLSRVVNTPTLLANPEFKALTDLSLIEKLMTLINRGPKLEGDETEILVDRAVTKMRENLEIYRAEDSRVIVIHYSSKDPVLAAAVPNAIAKAFLEDQAEAKKNSESNSTDSLKVGIDKLEKSLPLAEAAVAQYRAQNDILIGQNNSVLATQQLSELSSELTRVRAVVANATSRANTVRTQIESGASVDSIPEVLSSNLMQRLRERQVQLKSQIADLSTTLLDGHPQLKGLRSQLADLDDQIGNEVQKVLRSLQTEAQSAAKREQELINQLNGLKAESSRVGDDEVELSRLEREVTTQRLLLESYRARYEEAINRKDTDIQKADAKVYEAIIPSEAYFPKLIPSVIASFVGSLLLLSVIKLLRELFSGRAFKAAAVPAFKANDNVMQPDAVVLQDNTKALLDDGQPKQMEAHVEINRAYSIASVAARLIDDGETCAMIVSPEGNPACASSVLIARELADQGLRVVLLDLTGNSAAARPMLDGLALPGITNLLTGEAAIAGIIHADSYSDASVIPTGTADASKAAKAVARLPMIINSLISAFDMVIVECGASTPAGIQRLVMPGSGLLVSFIDADSKAVMSAMTELIAAGYDDLNLVTPVGSIGQEPVPGRSAA